MSRRSLERPGCLVLLVGLACLLLAGCGPGDPRAEALKQRSRWTVDLQSWAVRDDGSLSLSIRVTGPPTSSLETLTFRVSLIDAADQTFAEHWQVIDLVEVPRGAPKDMFFSLDPPDQPVEGVGLALVLDPTPEQELEIRELQ